MLANIRKKKANSQKITKSEKLKQKGRVKLQERKITQHTDTEQTGINIKKKKK